MAMLQRQKIRGPSVQFGIRLPKPIYDNLEDMAYKNRFTLSSYVVKILDKGLEVEGMDLCESYYINDEPTPTTETA